jgi:hypothetical protein
VPLMKRHCFLSIDARPSLPIGIRRDEMSEYLRSRTFERLVDSKLPRREVVRLAAAMAVSGVGNSAARAQWFGAIQLGIFGLNLVKKLWQVKVPLQGHFDINNDSLEPKRGTVLLATYDSEGLVEGSVLSSVVAPAKVSLTLRFVNGPPAIGIGDKTFEVRSSNDSDETDFLAV